MTSAEIILACLATAFTLAAVLVMVQLYRLLRAVESLLTHEVAGTMQDIRRVVQEAQLILRTVSEQVSHAGSALGRLGESAGRLGEALRSPWAALGGLLMSQFSSWFGRSPSRTAPRSKPRRSSKKR